MSDWIHTGNGQRLLAALTSLGQNVSGLSCNVDLLTREMRRNNVRADLDRDDAKAAEEAKGAERDAMIEQVERYGLPCRENPHPYPVNGEGIKAGVLLGDSPSRQTPFDEAMRALAAFPWLASFLPGGADMEEQVRKAMDDERGFRKLSDAMAAQQSFVAEDEVRRHEEE